MATRAGSPSNEDENRDPEGNERSRGPGGVDPDARQQLMDTEVRSLNDMTAEDGIEEKLAKEAAEAAKLASISPASSVSS